MVSFLTPFWSGADMMRRHLQSVRRFHPDAPILVSKRGGDAGLMSELRGDFGIEYWIEDCGYTDAYLRLLQRCPTQLACVLDHDTILLSSLDPFVERLQGGSCDLVGVEERIRLPRGFEGLSPDEQGWLRFSPGDVASNFLMFDWQAFKRKWGLRGVFGRPRAGARHFDFDYGIGQRLERHHYLQPFHVERYGIGTLLRDGERDVVWHQWYGSYRTRMDTFQTLHDVVQAGERTFLDDFPRLQFDGARPAWGATLDLEVELEAGARRPGSSAAAALRRYAGAHLRSWSARLKVGSERL
jgi:hypothetical protein